jgi:hypothetical protein
LEQGTPGALSQSQAFDAGAGQETVTAGATSRRLTAAAP